MSYVSGKSDRHFQQTRTVSATLPGAGDPVRFMTRRQSFNSFVGLIRNVVSSYRY